MAWSLPLASVIVLAEMAAFSAMFGRRPLPPPSDKPITVQLVALPASPAAAPLAPAEPAKPPAPVAPPPPPTPTEAPVETKPVPPVQHPRKPPVAHKPVASHPATPRSTPDPPQASPAPMAPAPTSSSSGTMTMGARALYKPMPEIPDALRHRQLSIIAVARFHVAADGSATVKLVQATSDPTLNTALIASLGQWRFFPAMSAGKPVVSTIDIRIPITVP